MMKVSSFLAKSCILATLVLCIAACTKGPDKTFSVVEEEQRDGYRCSLIEYALPSGEVVKSYLLVPDGAEKDGSRPGLVLLHDHGARFDIGKEKLVKPLASAPQNVKLSAEEWVEGGFDGAYFADSLASLGYVVIVPDMLYWGSRSTELCQKWSRMRFCSEEGDIKAAKDAVYEGQRAVYDSLAKKGIVWAEQTVQEDGYAADILKSSGYVDADRIGAFGWSMGAHRTWLLTAARKDIACGVALCWITLKETCAQPYKASDYSMLIPELREKYDFPDIAGELAPRPFLFLSGRTDHLFPLWSVEKAYEKMQAIYKEKGAEGRLSTEIFDGGHHCGKAEQRRIVDFFNENLGIGK